MLANLQRAGRARILAWAAAPLAVAAVTTLGRQAGANAPTIVSIYLVAVLGLAAWGGWAVGATASVAAMLCFNYFFLPPLGTLTIAEPANWVALLSFLAASTIASRLVATARRQADEAQQRRRQVETLYDLCFGLFTASQRSGALGEAAARTLGAIEASAGVLLLGAGGEVASVIGDMGGLGDMGSERIAVDAAAAERARATHRIVETEEEGGRWTTYLPLEVGGVLTGLLVARGALAPRAVLEPAGRLLALAVERERLLAESAHLVAMRESDTLKTSLLRAVSHDLRTPLTALRLEIESLDRHLGGDREGRALVSGLAREQERLARRIDNLLSLARLEAGVARPHPEPVPAASLFRAARESLASILGGRPLALAVAADCPELLADPALALEVLVNLLENAARAAPPEEPLELAAAADPETPGSVRIEVRDRGPGLPPGVRRLLESPRELRGAGDSGDAVAGGLGLQIAHGLAAANGGTLALLDRPGGGTIARLTLPATLEPIATAEPEDPGT